MAAFVALLRAVNVGGRRSVKMAELVALFGSLGFSDVRTYVQSGNVVFASPEKNAGRLVPRIEKAIAAKFGFEVGVVIRSRAEIRRIIAKNPFPAMAEADPGHLVVVFLPAPPDTAGKAALAAPWAGPEEVRVAGADLYITYPAGIGVSKLKLKPAASGTARNWKTVLALAAMVEETAG